MRPIDEKIISMRLDNSEFEEKAKKTVRTLEELDRGINDTSKKTHNKFDGPTKGVRELNQEVKKLDFRPLGNAISKITDQISRMGVFGTTMVATMAYKMSNSLVNTVKGFTVGPMAQGFQEYENKMRSIQTIYANTKSKGTTLQEIKDSLDDLNDYADKTIYSFSEMTRNIGTFTSAGIGLNDAKQAIKGFSNLAALAGADSVKTAQGMFQLSQALSSGQLKLQDWNSMVTAGVGGEIFQETLKETARRHGIMVDEILEKEGSFRESLKHGWATKEVITETLMKFTGDYTNEQLRSLGYTNEQIDKIQDLAKTANDAATKVRTITQLKGTLKEAVGSGWARTYEIIIGDFEEATERLSKVSDYFGEKITAFFDWLNNGLLKFKKAGGFEGIYKTIGALTGPVERLFGITKHFIDGIGLPSFSEGLGNLFSIIGDFLSKLKMSEEFWKKAYSYSRKTGEVVGVLFDISYKVGERVFSFIKGFFDMLTKADYKGISQPLIILGNKLSGLFTGTEDIKSLWESLKKTVGDVSNTIRDIDWTNLNPFKQGVVHAQVEKLQNLVSGIVQGKAGTRGKIDSLGSVVKNAKELAKSVPVAESLGIVWQKIKDGIRGVYNTIITILNTEAFKGNKIPALINALAFRKLVKAFEEFGKITLKSVNNVTSFLSIFGKLGNVFTQVQTLIQNLDTHIGNTAKAFGTKMKGEAFKSIAIGLLILAGALVILSLIPPDKLTKAISSLAGGALIISGLLLAMSKMQDFSASKIGTLVGTVLAISTSIWILSFAFKRLAKLNILSLAASAVIIFGFIYGMLKMIDGLEGSKKGQQHRLKGAAALMVSMSLSINTIANAIRKIASMDLGRAIQGTIVMGMVMYGLYRLIKVTGDLKKEDVQGKSRYLLTIATTVYILAMAVKKIGRMRLGDALQGSIILGAIMTGLYLIVQKSDRINTINLRNITALATAIWILTIPIKKLGKIPLWDLTKGLFGIGALLSFIVLTATFAGKASGSMEKLGRGMLYMGGGLVLFATGLGMLLKIAELVRNAPGRIVQGIEFLASNLLSMAKNLSPKIADTLSVLIKDFILFSLRFKWVLAEGFIDLIIAALEVGATLAPRLIKSLFKFAQAIIDGIAESFKNVNVDDLLKAVVAIGSVSMMSKLLAGLKLKVVLGAVRGAGYATLILGAIAIFMTALGALYEIPFVERLIEGGGRLLEDLGTAIGDFFGGIVGGFTGSFLSGVSKSLPTIAKNLTEFAKESRPFFETVENMDNNTVGKVQILSGAISVLAGAGFKQALTSVIDFFTGKSSMKDLGEGLESLGRGMYVFANTTKDIDPKSIDPAIGVAEKLSKLIDSMPKTKGVFGAIFGGELATNDFENLLDTIARAIGIYVKHFKDIDYDGVEKASKVTGAVAEILKALPPVLASDLGKAKLTASITNLGDSLLIFGRYMVLVGYVARLVDVNAIQQMVAPSIAMLEVAKGAKEYSGTLSYFQRKRDLSTFGNNLEDYGKSLVKFSASINGAQFDITKLGMAVYISQAMLDIASQLEKEGGVVDFFTGTKDLNKFGDNMVHIGRALRTFDNVTKSVKGDNAMLAASIALSLVQVYAAMEREPGAIQFWKGEKDISGFAKQLKSLGEGVSAFHNATKGVTNSGIQPALDILKGSLDALNNIQGFSAQNTAKFISNMRDLGSGILQFQLTTSWVYPTRVKAVLSSLDNLKSITDTMVNLKSANSRDTLNAFGSGLVEFSAYLSKLQLANLIGISRYVAEIKDMASSAKNIDISGVANIAATFALIGKSWIDNINQSLGDNRYRLLAKLSYILSSTTTDAFNEVSREFFELGAKLYEEINKGAGTKTRDLYNKSLELGELSANALISPIEAARFEKLIDMKIDEMGLGILKNIPRVRQDAAKLVFGAKEEMSMVSFFGVGVNAINGFAAGMIGGRAMIRDAGASLAGTALRAMRNTLEVRSPSRKTGEIARFAIAGFVNNLRDGYKNVKEAAGGIGKNAINALAYYADEFADLIDKEVVHEPKVKPVLDLSDFSVPELTPSAKFAYQGIMDSFGIADSIQRTTQETRLFEQTQNEQKISINYAGMFDGAQFVIRDDNDLEKLARLVIDVMNKDLEARGIKDV